MAMKDEITELITEELHRFEVTKIDGSVFVEARVVIPVELPIGWDSDVENELTITIAKEFVL
jgi:hypothetical protein